MNLFINFSIYLTDFFKQLAHLSLSVSLFMIRAYVVLLLLEYIYEFTSSILIEFLDNHHKVVKMYDLSLHYSIDGRNREKIYPILFLLFLHIFHVTHALITYVHKIYSLSHVQFDFIIIVSWAN